jgi:hypothetical protein
MDSYKYDKTKGYLIGLPARDMTVTEWKTYPEELTKAALKLGLYKLDTKLKEVKDA